jgi:microcystin-dependent protein
MADPFVAEIRIFPFNFPPKGWAFCDGQTLPIAQNTALFSLLGVTYGGNGTSNFQLPNMQGNAPMHPGLGPGLSDRYLGETGGSETVTVLLSEMPLHPHSMMATVEDGTQGTLTQNITLATSTSGQLFQTNTSANLVSMSGNALTVTGGSLPHNNMMPYITLSFCIAMQGVFPARP